MVREQIKTDYTDDEIKNLEAGKCFCGKPRSEFDKGMRVYCCKSHRSDWYERTTTWSNFKDTVLIKQGKQCKKCNVVESDSKKNYAIATKQWHEKIQKIPNIKELIAEIRVKELNDLEEKYQKIMDDNYIIEHELYFSRHDNPDIESKPNEYDFDVRFDVDHIVAVALDGDMWDEKNLQVLCRECHKDKTAADMKKIKAKRRGLKRFE
jgi:hypothetical protein